MGKKNLVGKCVEVLAKFVSENDEKIDLVVLEHSMKKYKFIEVNESISQMLITKYVTSVVKGFEALKAKIGQEEYNHTKQVAQDIVYKVEQLGKELAWDGIEKHAKAAEGIASKCADLSDEEIYNIIKTTVGMFNTNKILQ